MLSKQASDVNRSNLITKRAKLLQFTPIFLVASWLLLANVTQHTPIQFIYSVLYSFLGIIGAIFANLSGAGGGVVFIPIFNYLGFSDGQSLSTSFTIQCFGMTAGAIVWSRYYFQNFRFDNNWQAFLPIIFFTALMSIIGLWTAYSGAINPPSSLSNIFSVFSVLLGVALLLQLFLVKQSDNNRTQLSFVDYGLLLFVGYFGGLITAWLSVGVGELLVFFLIIRGFHLTMAIAAAVVVTAITVWSASVEHLWLNNQTVWQVAMFAGPGAIVGGILAKTLAAKISTTRLKLLLALWILFMGLA